LLVEVGLAAVDEDQQIAFAVAAREVHLLELRRPILVGLAEVRLVARRGGTVVGEGDDRLFMGLHGIGIGFCSHLQGSNRLGEIGHGGLEVLGICHR